MAGGAACSLLNAFDDIKQLGAGGSSGTATSPTSSTTSSASSSGSSVSSGSASSSGAGGGDAGTPLGIVVVAGRIIESGTVTEDRAFAVIDAASGSQLSRYPLSVIAAAHDSTTDLWYLFEASELPPPPGEMVRLHVGNIDPASGIWTEIGSKGGVVGLPAIIDAIDVGVLNQRLVYAAFDPTYDGGAVPPVGLAVVDTSQAAAPAPAFAPSGFVSGLPTFFGFLATPNANTPGGEVNLMTQNCGADAGAPPGGCVMFRYLLTIPKAATPPSLTSAALDQGTPISRTANGTTAAWGSLHANGPYDLVASPSLPADAGTATITRFVYSATAIDGTIPFPATGGGQFSGLVVSECLSTVVIPDRLQKLLYAVPLTSGGTVAQAVLNDNATVIYFEPLTRTVLMPFQPANANYHLDAWQLGGTSMAPTLTQKTGAAWAPPADIAVDAVAVRNPNPNSAMCP
jgi:hypothetical protein